jgi:hypothetical protein
MLEELNIDLSKSQDAIWAEVKERAETIYRVTRKTPSSTQTTQRPSL